MSKHSFKSVQCKGFDSCQTGHYALLWPPKMSQFDIDLFGGVGGRLRVRSGLGRSVEDHISTTNWQTHCCIVACPAIPVELDAISSFNCVMFFPDDSVKRAADRRWYPFLYSSNAHCVWSISARWSHWSDSNCGFKRRLSPTVLIDLSCSSKNELDKPRMNAFVFCCYIVMDASLLSKQTPLSLSSKVLSAESVPGFIRKSLDYCSLAVLPRKSGFSNCIFLGSENMQRFFFLDVYTSISSIMHF